MGAGGVEDFKAIQHAEITMEDSMKWAKPTVTEICIGMEINDYFPAEL